MNWNTTIFERKIDLTKPTTGVLGFNSLPDWFWDELDNAIDLDFERGVEAGVSTTEDSEFWDPSTSTLLVGSWTRGEDGLYSPDQTGEYAAIVNNDHFTVQIVWSQTVMRFNRPTFQGCYPGQVDLDSGVSQGKSGYLAYCLPGWEA